MCRGGTPQRAECHYCTLVAECHPGQFCFASELYPCGAWSFFLQFFTRFERSTDENYESVFLTIVRPNDTFDRRATKTWVWSFYGATIGQIFEILTLRDFGPWRHCSRKFPSTIYYPFWTPHGKKFRFGLFGQGTKSVKFPNFSPGEMRPNV